MSSSSIVRWVDVPSPRTGRNFKFVTLELIDGGARVAKKKRISDN